MSDLVSVFVDAYNATMSRALGYTYRSDAVVDSDAIAAGVKAVADEFAAVETSLRRALKVADERGEQILRVNHELNEFRDSALMYAAMVAERNEERDQLKARIDELERQASDLTREVEAKTRRLIEVERPVSAPPALDRRTTARPPAWGETQMQDGEHLAEADLPGMWETADLTGGETEGPEIPTVVDAELNGHEPTPFVEGGAL